MKKNILSAEVQAGLEAVRSEISDLLAQHREANKEAIDWRAKEAAFQEEIASLEAGIDLNDLPAVQILEGKRAQLAMIAQRIAALPVAGHDIEVRLKNRSGTFNTAIRAALVPAVNAEVSRITDAFRPFYRNSVSARRAAEATECGQFAHGILKRFHGLPLAPVSDATHALKVIDALLDGTWAVSFDPCLEAEALATQIAADNARAAFAQ